MISVAIDPVAGTTMIAQFESGPTGQLTILRTVDWSELAVVEVGAFPLFTHESIDELNGLMYVTSYSSIVQVIDTTTGQLEHTFAKPLWLPSGAAVDATRNLIYAVDGNDALHHPTGSITVLNGATETEVIEVAGNNDMAYPAVSPEHQRLYVPVDFTNGVAVFDTATNQIVGYIKGTGEDQILSPEMAIADDDLDRVFVLQFDPVGDQIASIAVIDSSTDTIVAPAIEFGRIFNGPPSMTYDSVRKQLIIAGRDIDTGELVVVTVDVISGAVVSSTRIDFTGVNMGFFGMAVDPNLHKLVVATNELVLEFEWVELQPLLPPTGPPATAVLAAGAGLLLVAGALALVRPRGRAR